MTLNVSASALSRTVRLLEDAIGKPLFVRSATGLTLTTCGTELLNGTRDAMRRIDDVVANEETASGEQGTFSAAASGPVLSRLLDRAIAAVVRDFDGARYRTTAVDEETAAAELLRGNLDLALIEAGPALELADALTCERLGDLELALLAPPTHPLAAGGEQALAADVALAKIVMVEAAMTHERSSQGVATVGSMESAEQLAEQGPFLTLLPPALVRPSFRIVARSDARISVTAIFRRPLGGAPPALVRAVLAAARTVVTGSR